MRDHERPTDELDTEPGGAGGTTVAEPPLIAPGRRLGERYLLERRLGHGGMAVVWLATDERLGRPVAVKILSDTLTADAEYLGRFRREARVAAGVQHPNLVPGLRLRRGRAALPGDGVHRGRRSRHPARSR